MMIDDFLNYLRYERNRSELTVRNYEKSLRDFESYFKNRESHLSWESVDSDIIRDWMESMMDKGDMASTVNNSLSAVRSFFRFALARGLVANDPAHTVKGPKKQKPLPQFVREADMDRLIDLPQMWGDSYADLRARTIIILFYETGIRLAELVGLNDRDVDFVSHQLKVTGKRNKQRIIPFGEELEKVWDWCDVLVLPTLSENFGLVVAEALERGKRVNTTDGAPAWGENLSRVERVDGGMWSGYGGRLIYLKGYREGTKEQRVELLRRAIELMSVGEMMAVS